jgi:hypothetical protein
MTKKELYQSRDSFGTALVVAIIDDFGVEALNWEPETIELELHEKYGQSAAPWNLDRFHAASSLMTTNLFFTSLTAFNAICSTLSFDTPIDGEFVPASLPEVVWGLTEARLLLGSEEELEMSFHRSIRLYVGKLLEEDGVLNPPEILNFAQMTKLGDPDLQLIADMPDLTAMFEANQAATKQDLEAGMLQRAVTLLAQIGGLDLDSSDLATFHDKIGHLLQETDNARTPATTRS